MGLIELDSIFCIDIQEIKIKKEELKDLTEKKYNEDYAKIMKEETEMIAKIKAETREKLLTLGTLQKKVKKEIVQFKYPCPMEDCRGFVSVKGFCGTCNCRVCTKCNQVMDAEHECNPDDVASFELIKKETKPCPKCGERIQKISGCDQMWCASEKIPGQPCGCLFSWKTGEIETGKINHNPEYYKFIKNNGLQIRNPGDVVCGGLVPYHIFHNILNRLKGHIKIIHPNEEFKTFSKDLMSMNFKEQPTILTMLRLFHRAIGDLTYVLQRLRRVARGNEDENLRLRIQYSVKEITKEDFAKKVMKINTDKKKAIEDALGILKKAHEGKDIEAIKTALDGINEAWKNASEELYKAQAEAQQASGAAAGSAGPEASQKSKDDSDDVQDVDFEEVK
mgnify:CR=1 FL=1